MTKEELQSLHKKRVAVTTMKREPVTTPKCTLDENGYCAQHKRVHEGIELELSQADTPHANKVRRHWTMKMQRPQPTEGMVIVGEEGTMSDTKSAHIAKLRERAANIPGFKKPCGCRKA